MIELSPSRIPAYRDDAVTVYLGDARDVLADLPSESIDCAITSPPYWGLRDYGVKPSVWGGAPDCAHRWLAGEPDHGRSCKDCGAWSGALGLEPTPEMFAQHMVTIFREVRRVLKPTGTAWVNLGDTYIHANKGSGAGIHRYTPGSLQLTNTSSDFTAAPNRGNVPGLKAKDLAGIPWRVALALQADGWYLRTDIIYVKPSPMPESVTDRPTRSHEFLFLMSKRPRYFYDHVAVLEPRSSSASGGRPVRGIPGGRNRRTVWVVPREIYRGRHTATFPSGLVEPCVLAGTSESGCCAACGSPWVRVSQSRYRGTWRGRLPGIDRYHKPAFPGRMERDWITAGWQPTCTCGAGRVPATVLDLFAGSGTTLAVAKRLGRLALGIEIQPRYLGLIRERCQATSPPPAAREAA